jgi:hypothetical protein
MNEPLPRLLTRFERTCVCAIEIGHEKNRDDCRRSCGRARRDLSATGDRANPGRYHTRLAAACDARGNMNDAAEIVSALPNAQDLIEAETTLTALEAQITIFKIVAALESKRARWRVRRRLHDYLREHGRADMPHLTRLLAALTEPEAER